MVLRFPPCLLTGAHALYTPLRRVRLFLVGCCVSRCWLAAIQRQWCILYIFFSLFEFVTSNDWTPPPHTLQPPRPSSTTSILPRLPTTIWLFYLPIKWRPPKAKTQFPLYFFDVPSFRPPNRQTSHRAAKPDHGRLALDHKEPQRHWLVALIAFLWRDEIEGKAGVAAAAHFGCCVLCGVCCGCGCDEPF